MRELENISGNIESFMNRLGIGTADLAKKLGVQEELVDSWIRGESFPEVEMLPRIANSLNVLIDDLFLTNIEHADLLGHSASEDDLEHQRDEQDSNKIILNGNIRDLDLILEGNASVIIRQSEDDGAYLYVYGSDDFRNAVYYSEEQDLLLIKASSYKQKSFLGQIFDFSRSGSNDQMIIELPEDQARDLRAEINGSSNLKVEQRFSSVEFEVSGAADINMNEADYLHLGVRGAANIDIDKVVDFYIYISGSANCNINYARRKGDVSIKGSGEVTLGDSVIEDLSVDITGQGKFESDLSVKDISVNLVGSGDVSVREVRGKRAVVNVGQGEFTVADDK